MATAEILIVEEDAETLGSNAASADREITEAMAKVADWFEKDKEAKLPINREIQEWDKIAQGRHWDIHGEDGEPLRTEAQKKLRPNVVENVAFALVDGLVSEFSVDMEMIDVPTAAGDEKAAEKMTKLKRYLAQKNRLLSVRQKFNRHLFGHGTGILHVYWDQFWQGGRGPNRWIGDVRFEAPHPLSIFPDARCGEDINNGYRLHHAVYVPIEYVRERWPNVEIQADLPDPDIHPGDDDSRSATSTEDMVLLIGTWYKGAPLLPGDEDEEYGGRGLHCIWWAGEGQRVYLDHANYVYYKGEEPKFPYIFRSRYPRDGSVWGLSEYHYLKSPQIVLNKTTEMILEGHLQTSMGTTFYEAGAVDERQRTMIGAIGGIPGAWIEVNDIHGIKSVFGQNLPASLQNEPVRLQRTMETLIGRFDISQGRTPGSVTAFRALDLLSHRAQVRLRAAEMAVTTAFEDLGRYVNQILIENYTEGRVYRVIGKEDEPEMQFDTFSVDDIKQVWMIGTNTVVPFKGFVAPEGAQEGTDYEIFAPEFDCDVKLSSTLPTDRIVAMEMAKELLMGGLIDTETFFYVMEHGRFPPWSELAQKAAQREAMQQQMAEAQMAAQAQPVSPEAASPPAAGMDSPMAQPGAGMAMAGGAPPPGQPLTPEAQMLAGVIENLPPDIREAFFNLSTDEQMAVLTDLQRRRLQ